MKKLDDPFDDPLVVPFDACAERTAPDDTLRSALLAQTVGVLRFRRRLKRCALAASLLGCYFAGITTMGLMRTGGEQRQPLAAKSQPVAVDVRNVAPAANDNQLAAKKPTAFESWRRIGDHYLRESGDVSLAVAGYSEAINLASKEERAISPERDNWLVMALKLDAQSQERTHAYPKQP
jgi:hypothetical protein